MNFGQIKEVTIPEGSVTEIKIGSTVVWKKNTAKDVEFVECNGTYFKMMDVYDLLTEKGYTSYLNKIKITYAVTPSKDGVKRYFGYFNSTTDRFDTYSSTTVGAGSYYINGTAYAFQDATTGYNEETTDNYSYYSLAQTEKIYPSTNYKFSYKYPESTITPSKGTDPKNFYLGTVNWQGSPQSTQFTAIKFGICEFGDAQLIPQSDGTMRVFIDGQTIGYISQYNI